jgi:hypothetical protein
MKKLLLIPLLLLAQLAIAQHRPHERAANELAPGQYNLIPGVYGFTVAATMPSPTPVPSPTPAPTPSPDKTTIPPATIVDANLDTWTLASGAVMRTGGRLQR